MSVFFVGADLYHKARVALTCYSRRENSNEQVLSAQGTAG
jgi:hypothetical protein